MIKQHKTPGCETSNDTGNMLSCLWDKIFGVGQGIDDIEGLIKRISTRVGNHSDLSTISDLDERIALEKLIDAIKDFHDSIEAYEREAARIKEAMRGVVDYIPWLPPSV
jgi:hypothetical protein